MASSSPPPPVKRFDVFPSFHGGDVRRKFLSHVRDHFARKGITTFNDKDIERGHSIGPELIRSISESRLSIVILSKNYASSSWCLDELVEILKCKEDENQMVMTVFYDVDPSDVRKQKGDFGDSFKKSCQRQTEQVKEGWVKALTHVADIEGEHSLNWDNEAEMIQKTVTDVLNKLHDTPSNDFKSFVGMEAHLSRLDSLLCLESPDVKMVGIWGPSGIGKSSIAKAMFDHLSSSFQLKCFMENLRGSPMTILGKLDLQRRLLSMILEQRELKVPNLDTIKKRLQDQRVLIVLDNVDDPQQLEVLAKEPSWFGYGSRIIVTTLDENILKAPETNEIYRVDYPPVEEALEILCQAAFDKRIVPDGLEEIAKEIAKLCGNLPLALSVVGSSLRGKSKHEWECQLTKTEASLGRSIENVLRVRYDILSKKDQSIFLHIACFFFDFIHESVDYVTAMLADSDLDVENGLKTLAVKSLLDIYYDGSIKMHSLLEKLGRQVVHEESNEPGKRQFLVESEEVRHVLTTETGSGSIIGITFEGNDMDVVFSIHGRVFEGMKNLRFLRIHGTLGISEDLEYLPRLRLLEWYLYPNKQLPPTFQPECLIELLMRESKLEWLWKGIKRLPNLKKIDLSRSYKLKEIPNLSKAMKLKVLNLKGCKSLEELPSSFKNLQKLENLNMFGCTNLRVIASNINSPSLEVVDMTKCSRLTTFPDLSKATNLKNLKIWGCTSLVELPSSIKNLQKLKTLDMRWCDKLQVIPTNINLASLEEVHMNGCYRLRTFPNFSSNIKKLNLGWTKIEDVPASVARSWLCLDELSIGSRNLKGLTHVPRAVRRLDLSNSVIKKIPDCVIALPHLTVLNIKNCMELVSLPSFPPSLYELNAIGCRSLESVCLEKQVISKINFRNCLKLDEEMRRAIRQRWVYEGALLPGKVVPVYFTHRATGNSITISQETISVSSRFKACIMLSQFSSFTGDYSILCRLRSRGVLINELKFDPSSLELSDELLTEHLLVFSGDMFKEHRCFLEITGDIQFEFSFKGVYNGKIMECGVHILLAEEGESSSGSQWKEEFDGVIPIANPQVQYVSIEDIPEEIKEKEIKMQTEDLLTKSEKIKEKIKEKIVEGTISKWLGEIGIA